MLLDSGSPSIDSAAQNELMVLNHPLKTCSGDDNVVERDRLGQALGRRDLDGAGVGSRPAGEPHAHALPVRVNLNHDLGWAGLKLGRLTQIATQRAKLGDWQDVAGGV